MLKRNLIANHLGQGWTGLMGLAFIPLYIKYLGVEAYGLIGLFAVLTAWLSLLDIGMSPTLGREIARFTGGGRSNESMRDLLRTIEVISLLLAVFIAGAIAMGSGWVASSWLKPDALPTDVVAQAFAIMGLVAALRLVEGIYRSALIGLQQQVIFNVVNATMAALRGLGAVGILAWVSPTIGAFFLWQGTVSILALGVLAFVTYTNFPKGHRAGRFSVNALRGVGRFAGGMLGITFLALLLTQIDKILLSRLLSLTEVGYYTLAATVAAALFLLIGPIVQAFYPKFCELHARSDQDGLAENYHKAAQLVSITAGSAAIVLILYSETFLHLWTQDAELATRVAPLLSLLVLGNLLNGLNWVPYHAQLAHGITRLGIYVNLVAVFLIVPAILWIVPIYGAEGAAWIWVSLNAGYLFIGAQLMYRRILRKEKWEWYRKDILAPLVPAVVMVFFVKMASPEPESYLAMVMVLLVLSILTPIISLRCSSRIWILMPALNRQR